jgi:beta-glucosidase
MRKAAIAVLCALAIAAVVRVARSQSGAPPGFPKAEQQAGVDRSAKYWNTSLPIEERVNDLVARMTLEEKASQMQFAAPAIPRLGIPAYNWWNEALHGVARAGYATVFPQAIGLAATWDTELMHRVADVISTEARAKYNDAIAHDNHAQYYGLTFWSPNINIFRDPRWGRGQETYGEDPFLTGQMAVAFVTGMQGDDAKYLKVVSTPKHYAVHSGPESLRHRMDVDVSARDYEDTYTPAFRAAIVEGKADSVMCAYNSVRGYPACASPSLYDTLRGKWGFGGYTVSDCGAISDFYEGHGFTEIPEAAAALAVKAGTDLTCGGEYRLLPRAERDHLISMPEIDRAVARLMTARMRLGMFDGADATPWSKLTLAGNDTDAHRAVAREAARESIVLLKNERGALPLKPSVRTIAVIGPTADSLDVLLGNYNGTPSRYTTILQGIQKRFANAKILSVAGSTLTETDAVPIPASALRTGGAGSAAGLKAEFFAGRTLGGSAVASRVDAAVKFDWGTSAPASGVARDFSARWSGEILAAKSGDYRIGAQARGGFRVFVDGELLVDDWRSRYDASDTRTVTLQAGHAYKIVLEYASGADGSGVRLAWNAPGMADDAVDAARKADATIAVVGISPALEGEEADVNAPGFFGGDRVDLDLPRPQRDMLEAVAATGKPLIVVLTNGSALAVNWAQEHAAAILDAWYPGEEGGAAVADVLAGDYNPAGRLPVTFYEGVGQLPPFTDYSMEGRTYRYFRGTPLYPFGYGLSYTNFAYSNARMDRASVAAGESATVSVDVQNTGTAAGDEVVEMYVTHPDVAGAPMRSLAGFQRVRLDRGEKKTVTLKLGEREMSVVDEDGARLVPGGEVDVWVGGGQPAAARGAAMPAGAWVKFTVTGVKAIEN